MPFIFKKYGYVVEITEHGKKPKDPSEIRVPITRKRRTVFTQRRLDNVRRTRQICLRRMLSAVEEYGNPLLVTLTFKGDASDASYANDSLRTFQVRLRTKYPKAQSLFVPELSPKGRIHFHGLLFNVPMHLGDTRKNRRILKHGSERESRILAKLWGEGFVDATQTDGSIGLAYYLSKYITKGSGETLFNAMRILRISHGFPKEIVIRGEFAEMLAHRYAKVKPVREWSSQHMFLKTITKKIYHL